jgi:hypothetical protein
METCIRENKCLLNEMDITGDKFKQFLKSKNLTVKFQAID